jgi:GIY-YIG catalytic domain-containing protein
MESVGGKTLQLDSILKALSDRPREATDAPDAPGLYAIFGSKEVWEELGLGTPIDERPLYVGKAEKSLLRRDVRQHFGTGNTGSSTVRRSIAALLKNKHGYVGVPRNPKKPAHFSNYALGVDHDQMLTEWMLRNLRLGTWEPETADGVVLDTWETKVLDAWKPPLNLSKVRTGWTVELKRLRKALANEAREWVGS